MQAIAWAAGRPEKAARRATNPAAWSGRAWEGLRLSQLTRCTSRGMGTTTSSPLAALSALNSGLMRMLMFACAYSMLP